jgi:hypothetical protein
MAKQFLDMGKNLQDKMGGAMQSPWRDPYGAICAWTGFPPFAGTTMLMDAEMTP